MSKSASTPTIGVFDSGFGGLTVLRELLPLVAGAHYIYLGDTARLPYGSKSRETIVRYAVSSARFLQQQGAELLVVACNTATALALDDLREALPIPVVGVIEPGAEAAAGACAAEQVAGQAQGEASDSLSQVLVLATQATVGSLAYTRACAALGLRATEKACPLLVPLVEEGWIVDSESESAEDAARASVTAQVLRIYLNEALHAAPHSRALLLGCTHYPLLRPEIERTLAELGRPLRVIDSARATARAVAKILSLKQAAKLGTSAVSDEATCEFFATDSVQKFERLGSRFLGRPVEGVRLVDLGG
ncbi:MAG: glutamate racemase [Acidobacteriaceae bacterium]|nr:glutamate racemase [Acidobacteriaceae bacterium]